jgi:ADP-ribose pyrophosphatase YjhB (NUDIX family)
LTTDSVVRRSIAVAIPAGHRPGLLLLLVRRPLDDDDLPGIWGLPASSLRSGEEWLDAVLRTGSEKLGVDLVAPALLHSGSTPRSGHILSMRLYSAVIAAGTPRVPQPFPDVTQYLDLRWGPVDDLRAAASHGSLCARLCIEALARPGA